MPRETLHELKLQRDVKVIAASNYLALLSRIYYISVELHAVLVDGDVRDIVGTSLSGDVVMLEHPYTQLTSAAFSARRLLQDGARRS